MVKIKRKYSHHESIWLFGWLDDVFCLMDSLLLRYKWNSVQNMHLIIFFLFVAWFMLCAHTSLRKSQVLRQSSKNRLWQKKKSVTALWNIYGDDLMSSEMTANQGKFFKCSHQPTNKKKKTWRKILVTEKRNGMFCGKSWTKRNIWNYCRKMNLENQQKCHWANSFRSFFSSPSTRGILRDREKGEPMCNCYLTYRKVAMAYAHQTFTI